MSVFDEIIDELGGATFFSKLDHQFDFHQIWIKKMMNTRPHSNPIKIIMHIGSCPLDWPTTFQDFMNHLLAPLLRKCVVVFLDDILGYSATLSDHVEHLKQVFELLSQQQLHLKRSKCLFAQDKLEFLGHVVSASASGIATDPKKVKII